MKRTAVSLLLFLAALPLTAQTPLPDRTVAEWALRSGGSVILERDPRRYWDVAELPRTDFRLHTVNLVGVVMDLGEFEKLRGLAHLKELYMSGRFWHSVPGPECERSLRFLETLTGLERFAVS